MLYTAKTVLPNAPQNNEKAGLAEIMGELLCKYKSQQKHLGGKHMSLYVVKLRFEINSIIVKYFPSYQITNGKITFQIQQP